MKKDFQKWHNEKKEINTSSNRLFFHEREVWWCSIGVNIGYEQDGKGNNFSRPVLVFKKFNNEVFWALPITTKIKSGKYYEEINLNDNQKRVVIISQLRLVDAKRLISKVETISKDNYEKIQKMVMNLCSS